MIKIICGFPGVGESYYHKRHKDISLDSDSSSYPKDENWPENYINPACDKANRNTQYLLMSTHSDVRRGLDKQGFRYLVVIPEYNAKQAYLDRFIKRGSSEAFVGLMRSNWDGFHDSCLKGNGIKVILPEQVYLTEFLQLSEREVVHETV